MLYTYSDLALSENWLNATIINILDDGMQRILAGNELIKWPDILPQERKNILRTRHGIKTRIEVFFAEFSKLELEMKQELLKTLRQQSSFPNVFIDDSVCLKIDFFPKKIQTAADELFRFLFEEQLKTLFVGGDSLRDYHYKNIFQSKLENLSFLWAWLFESTRWSSACIGPLFADFKVPICRR